MAPTSWLSSFALGISGFPFTVKFRVNSVWLKVQTTSIRKRLNANNYIVCASLPEVVVDRVLFSILGGATFTTSICINNSTLSALDSIEGRAVHIRRSLNSERWRKLRLHCHIISGCSSNFTRGPRSVVTNAHHARQLAGIWLSKTHEFVWWLCTRDFPPKKCLITRDPR